MKTAAIETTFFAFESDFAVSLRCIPMVVRYKLDAVRIKLKLPEWARFSLAEKQELANRPCHTPNQIEEYRQAVVRLIAERCRHGATELTSLNPSWDNLSEVPAEVNEKAAEWECPPVSLSQWINLPVLQRFALVKLSRSGHEGENLPRAMREFGLVD